MTAGAPRRDPAAISRRTLLLGAVGAAALAAGGAGALLAVEHGVLPGRIRLGAALGRCAVDAAPPAVDAGPLLAGRFDSALRRRSVQWVLALPPGRSGPRPAAGLPVALVLHGHGDDARSAFDQLGMHRFLAAHVAAGGVPFALASVDGGTAYWHPRASGDDPLGMIVHELLPRLAAAGLRTDRVGATGWSMGGFGALLLARQSGRAALGGCTVAAAAAASPALFPSFAAAAPGAFDDAADFAAWGDLLADPGVAPTTRLSVSCGDTDAFTAVTQRYRAAVRPAPAGGISRGCHTQGYWRSVVASQLTLLGTALAG